MPFFVTQSRFPLSKNAKYAKKRPIPSLTAAKTLNLFA